MIEAGSIHVWRFPLDAGLAPKHLQSLKTVLSAEEVSRADRFHREGHREDYVTAHVALRYLLGSYLNVTAAEVKLAANSATEGGSSRNKPALDVTSAAQTDLRFNLSHTHGAAMAAFAKGIEVGVDVEWQRPLEDLNGMAETVMSAAELTRWKAIDDVADASYARQLAFYNLWTRKESYLKAIGLGLFRDLQGVTVPVFAERMRFESESTYDSAVVEDQSGDGSWRILDLPVANGYSASLCFDATGLSQRSGLPKISVMDLDLNSIRRVDDRFEG